MITVVSDTHGDSGHRLEGRTLAAVREADLVLHAGDLMTESVLEAFQAESARFLAVRGNNDRPLADRLPAERVVDHDGVRVALVHGHDHHGTALDLFGREAEADLVVVGHSHRPTFDDRGEVPRLNPGSHAHPRQYRPAHAELDLGSERIEGRLVRPDGTVFEEFVVPTG